MSIPFALAENESPMWSAPAKPRATAAIQRRVSVAGPVGAAADSTATASVPSSIESEKSSPTPSRRNRVSGSAG